MLIRQADHIVMPWKNGGGSTREIARQAGDGDLYWRLSLATIDRDGPFSTFPGCERIILLLEGRPMTLRFADGETLVLNRGEPRRFSCERPVQAVLPDPGERRDLNLIWADGKLDADVRVVRLDGHQRFDVGATYKALVVATGGAALACIADNDDRVNMAAGDTLVIDAHPSGEQSTLSFEGAGAELVLFTLRKKRG